MKSILGFVIASGMMSTQTRNRSREFRMKKSYGPSNTGSKSTTRRKLIKLARKAKLNNQ